MKKIFSKILLLSIITIIISQLFNISIVKANNEVSIKSINRNELDLMNDSKPKIMKYDATTNTTTEVNMDEIKKELNAKNSTNNSQLSLSYDGYNPLGLPYYSFNGNENSLLLVDNLQKVNNVNVFPYNTICRINYNGGSGTGVLLGRNFLLTAAHVVFDKNNNKFENWIAGAGSSNFQAIASSGWSQVYYYENWVNNWKYDIAICVLNEPIGIDVGYMGFQLLGDSILSSLPGVTSVGYPEEREATKYQYYSKGHVKNVAYSYFTTDCYTCHGMSGGPIINDETGHVLGVTQGRDVLNTSQRTSRISSDIYNILASLRDEG